MFNRVCLPPWVSPLSAVGANNNGWLVVSFGAVNKSVGQRRLKRFQFHRVLAT